LYSGAVDQSECRGIGRKQGDVVDARADIEAAKAIDADISAQFASCSIADAE
jgi:hypothetical protein